jgi:hypothetical protein
VAGGFGKFPIITIPKRISVISDHILLVYPLCGSAGSGESLAGLGLSASAFGTHPTKDVGFSRQCDR